MRDRAVKFILCGALLAAAATASARAQAQGSEAPLTNTSVIKLVRAGFSEKTVIAIIRTRPARFDLSPDRLIELKKNRVSERVILAMIGRDVDEALVASSDSDDWGSDEAFFGRGGAPGAGRGAGDPGGVNIFGSSGGSRGRTRQNGVGGGSEGETQTTGSATVRILRPPAEAGGAGAPKLERTPTLTNDSVVELVEAGFSEGTIIRRIEQSPAEFDLSDAKLAELRKRRVSETVIAAMRAAMNGDDEPARPEN